jgi:hypothetical protein
MHKLIVKIPKPRNPMVAAGHMRRAGAHRRSVGALRQRANLALRLEFEQLPHRRP